MDRLQHCGRARLKNMYQESSELKAKDLTYFLFFPNAKKKVIFTLWKQKSNSVWK